MSTGKKKVLVIVPRVPYPQDGGGKSQIFVTLSILHKLYHVRLIIVDDTAVTEEQRKAMEKVSATCDFFCYSKLACYANVIKKFISGEPLQVSYFYFKEVQAVVDATLPEVDFSYVFINRTAKYVFGSNKPVIFNAIDSLYLSYSNSIDNTKSFFWNTIYKIEAKRLFHFEKKCVEQFACSFFVNVTEAEFWKKYGNAVTLPVGVNASLFEYNKISEAYKNVVVFFGRMSYRPNVDAVKWFCEKILPHLDKDIEFWIVGAAPSEAILRLPALYPNVKVTGFIEDPFEIIRSSICNVSPMRSGGGILNKMLTSMSVECVALTTSFPMAALPMAINGKHLIVEDDPQNFASIINDIYHHPEKYDDIKKNARVLIKEYFDWESIETKMVEAIEESMNK